MTIIRKTDTTLTATDNAEDTTSPMCRRYIILLYSILRQTRSTWRCKNLKDLKDAIFDLG